MAAEETFELYVRDEEGVFQPVPALIGPRGEKGEKGDPGDPSPVIIDDSSNGADRAWSAQKISTELGGKSSSGHTHTKSEITDFPSTMTPAAHNQAASTISAGTFGGKVNANATAAATVTSAQVRDIYAGTAALTAGSSSLTTGTIYVQYE